MGKKISYEKVKKEKKKKIAKIKEKISHCLTKKKNENLFFDSSKKMSLSFKSLSGESGLNFLKGKK